MHLSEMKSNPLANAWKIRFSNLPELKKEKINKLSNMLIPEYQLKVIKRTRKYPEIGDIFQINPKENIRYYGVVINNHINNHDGEDLILIIILNNDEKIEHKLSRTIVNKDLLIPPCIVGKEYWSHGFFFNVAHQSSEIKIESFGFYNIIDGFIYDEYDKYKYEKEPNIISMGGVYTISGIAYDINKEIIIREV